jgi:hypothetical protein
MTDGVGQWLTLTSQWSTMTGLGLGLGGPGQGRIWAELGQSGPDTCRSLVQPHCRFGLLLGLWFTRRGSPWTRTCGAWTEGPVRGGLSPPLLPPSLGPQRTRCTRVQLPSSFPLPKLLYSRRGVPAGGEWAVGQLLVRSFPPPSPFFDWGKAGPVERGTDDRSAWRCPRAAATSGGAPVVPRP